jgi:hypothetical protein
MDNFIIAACGGGISNRVKCLVSAWRIENKFGRKTILFWPKNSICGCHFKDLFENDIKEVDIEEIRRLLKDNSNKFLKDNKNVFEDKKEKFLISRTPRFILFKGEIQKNFAREMPAENGLSIDHEFNRIPKKLQKEILIYLKKLKPLKKLQDSINKFNNKNKISKCVGVHIRKGDFIVKGGPGDFSVDERFIKRMKEISDKNKKQKFFLCTDSPEVETKLKKIFGNKIIIFQKTNFDRTDVIFTQEGLIDLLLLAKTKYILGTYVSTFTEMAWWFGGCKANIETMATLEERKQLVKNIKKQQGNIITRIKIFVYKLIIPPYKRIKINNR